MTNIPRVCNSSIKHICRDKVETLSINEFVVETPFVETSWCHVRSVRVSFPCILAENVVLFSSDDSAIRYRHKHPMS